MTPARVRYRELLLIIEGGKPLIVEDQRTPESERSLLGGVSLGGRPEDILPPITHELYVRPAENAWHELGETYRATLGWQGKEPGTGKVARIAPYVYRFWYAPQEVGSRCLTGRSVN